MAKRPHKRRGQKRKIIRRPKTSQSSRDLFVADLPRRPCLWDVLIHELAVVLSGRYLKTRNQLSTRAFWFSNEKSVTVGWMLARGFEIFISRNWPAGLCEDLKDKLWHLDESSAGQIAEHTASQCFEPLLRKYVEDTQGLYPSRPHSDLTKVTLDLAEALRAFLLSRCASEGNLYKCLTNPLADHNRYFLDNGEAADPIRSCGDSVHDVYLLGLTIHDEDDGGDLKRKLAHMVRNDPWLSAEWRSSVQREMRERQQSGPINDSSTTIQQITDDFIFRATHLAGKTPIQLLIERQKSMSERQKQRLLRWDRETFCGQFLIRAVETTYIEATDLASDRNYRLEATEPEALRSLKPNDLLFSRVTPWDDHWLLSGIQQYFQGAGKDQNLVSQLRQEARSRPSYRHIDNDEPGIKKDFKAQEAQYQAWMALYGQEELLFEDGLKLGAAMNRFHRYWNDEMILPDSGLTRAQLYQQKHGNATPGMKSPLPDQLLEAKDTAIVFDQKHGMAFYVGYGLFRSAFEEQGPLSPEQIQRVWDYLVSESTDYWLFQRMRDQYPERTQYVFRQVLKDEQFQLDRDFDPTLGKFKGEAMRRPLRPMVKTIDSQSDHKSERKVLK